MDNVPPQVNGDPAQQLVNLIGALNQRIQQLEQAQPAPAPQAQQQQQLPGENSTNRSAAFDFGFTPEQVNTSWRELNDRIRAVPIPSSTNVNSTKPRGASAAAKAELDTISKAATVARILLQLQTLRNELNAEQLAQACLVTGLHLTALLQQRQGDLFVESTFPEAFDTFRALRAGPGGSLAGEELQRLSTAIQLANTSSASRRGNPNPGRGQFNNNNNYNGYNGYNHNSNRGGHRGGYSNNNNNSFRGGFNNNNFYNNQRGGYNGQDRGGDQ